MIHRRVYDHDYEFQYCIQVMDLLHLLENTFDRKRISANPSSNPKAQ